MGIGIREAREKLPSLVKRVAFGQEDIALGTRGSDEVTLVSSDKYARLKSELSQLRAELAELRRLGIPGGGHVQAVPAEPFAGLQAALDSGRLHVGPEPRVRRFTPEETDLSATDRETRIRIGSRGTHEPERRRTAPRA